MRARSTITCSAIAAAATAFAPCATSQAATFARGPYLQDLGSRQVAVMLELEGPHQVSIEVTKGAVGQAGASSTKVSGSGSDTVHEIVIGGLEPATSYRYTVAVDDGTLERGTFTTAPEDDRPFTFLLYGDNRTDDASHAAIVAAMRNAPGDFILQTGDMVDNGSDPSLWLRFFGIERELLRNRCLFPAIGNHEVWLPTSDGAEHFAHMFRLPAPAGASERYYTFRWGSARFFMLDAQDDFATEERAWLESSLDAADAEPGLIWRFVVLHNGPFSSGLHGPNRSLVVARVPELMRLHKVDMILSGHDHIYERGEVEGLKYLVSGGGGAPLYPQHRDETTAFRFEAVHHYISIDVGKAGGSFIAIRQDGSTIERCAFGTGASSWACPSSEQTSNAPFETASKTPNAPNAPPRRRACDCSFALSGTEWIGAVLATVLLLALGVRRKTRPDERADDEA